MSLTSSDLFINVAPLQFKDGINGNHIIRPKTHLNGSNCLPNGLNIHLNGSNRQGNESNLQGSGFNGTAKHITGSTLCRSSFDETGKYLYNSCNQLNSNNLKNSYSSNFSSNLSFSSNNLNKSISNNSNPQSKSINVSHEHYSNNDKQQLNYNNLANNYQNVINQPILSPQIMRIKKNIITQNNNNLANNNNRVKHDQNNDLIKQANSQRNSNKSRNKNDKENMNQINQNNRNNQTNQINDNIIKTMLKLNSPKKTPNHTKESQRLCNSKKIINSKNTHTSPNKHVNDKQIEEINEDMTFLLDKFKLIKPKFDQHLDFTKNNLNQQMNIQNNPNLTQNFSRIRKNSSAKSKSIQQALTSIELEDLSKKITHMQNIIKQNTLLIEYHSMRISALQQNSSLISTAELGSISTEQSKHLQTKTTESNNNLLHTNSLRIENEKQPILFSVPKQKYPRAYKTSSQLTLKMNVKEISDIMSLIEQTKNYQIKNSEDYRKNIQSFRETILQFRDQLNNNVKKDQFDDQMRKVAEKVVIKHIDLLNKKDKAQELETLITSMVNTRTQQQIKLQLKRLQEQYQSIKSQIVKFNVRGRKSTQENMMKIQNMDKRISEIEKLEKPQKLQKSGNQQKQQKNEDAILWKRSSKHRQNDSKVVCFSITQSLSLFKDGISSDKLIQNRKASCFAPIISPEGSSIQLKKQIYFIDQQGYILDKDQFYLLNNKNQQVRLSLKEIQFLKYHKILECEENSIK